MTEDPTLVLDGFDSVGRPRQLFATELARYGIPRYLEIAVLCILRATTAGDPGSDWHWMSEACFEEARRRRCPGLYSRAVERISGEQDVIEYLPAVRMVAPGPPAR